MKNIKETILYSFLFFLLIAADQAKKLIVLSHPEQYSIFKNDHFAFSLNVPTVAMYFIYIVLLCALVIWFGQKKYKQAVTKLGFVFILAGALSNIGERIIRGYVVDFIHIHTGVLNAADFYILAGILLLLLETDKKTDKAS